MAFALGGNLLDFLVLAILRYGDMYGYVLTQHAKGVVNISDSTLYPVLRRLRITAERDCPCVVSAHVQQDKTAVLRYCRVHGSGQDGDIKVCVSIFRRDNTDSVLAEKRRKIRSSKIGIDNIQIDNGNRNAVFCSGHCQIDGKIGFAASVMPSYSNHMRK